jgi:hypothetical protein
MAYCKQCGHRSDEKTESCSKCGAKLATAVAITPAAPAKVRWKLFVLVAMAAAVVFYIVPRFFLQTELETIGPTDKLRFLRAMEHSAYRRAGQESLQVDGQTLVVVWDLRWNTLPEAKQQEIVRITGKAWHVVGGENTRFQIEGEDNIVGSYP